LALFQDPLVRQWIYERVEPHEGVVRGPKLAVLSASKPFVHDVIVTIAVPELCN